VAIPLLDESGQAFAILSLYSSWPGFFSAVTREAMLRHIQQAMSHAILHCEQTKVIPTELRRTYRQYLKDGAVQMLYQPIVNLHTGKLDSIEALARLRNIQGKIIAPDAFLPAFGNANLLRLFQLGMDQVCRDTRVWRERDPPLNLPVSLNLPQEGLTQDAYRDSVFETLSRWKLPASILRLEMLEAKESLDMEKRDARIAEFRQAGIQVIQDDLGSGHSSLLRMERIPCDRVKIDQGLVRSALNNPVRALKFIYYLTLLVHDFDIPVTVEGLEDNGLIEAAAILGADYGQGYGIARPMPAQDLMTWSQTWSLPVDPERPCTALGALADYLLWDRKLGMLKDLPDIATKFINNPCLVQCYLDCNGKSDPNLSKMLEHNRIVALQDPESELYALTRQNLIERLGALWLKERK
jgi:EAL domain-containing protein (putative c-di-GMP-specific phosphodiesterase class I)